MRGVPTGRAVENKKFSWKFFFHPLYLHGGQPLSVGIFCAFRHNIKVFGVVIDGTFLAQRVVIRRTISGQKHCYRGHISGDFRCYQRHNFLQYVLLSTTQFPADFPTIAPSAVVIRRTFPRTTAPRRHCYPRHNSRFYRDFSAFFQKSSGCYPPHNSRWRWLRGRCCFHRHFLRHGLLSVAHFPFCRFFAARIVIRSTVPKKAPCCVFRGLLSTAQFLPDAPRVGLLSTA